MRTLIVALGLALASPLAHAEDPLEITIDVVDSSAPMASVVNQVPLPKANYKDDVLRDGAGTRATGSSSRSTSSDSGSQDSSSKQTKNDSGVQLLPVPVPAQVPVPLPLPLPAILPPKNH